MMTFWLGARKMIHNLIIIDKYGKIRKNRKRFIGSDIADAFKRSSTIVQNVTYTENNGVIYISATLVLPYNVEFIKIDT